MHCFKGKYKALSAIDMRIRRERGRHTAVSIMQRNMELTETRENMHSFEMIRREVLIELLS